MGTRVTPWGRVADPVAWAVAAVIALGNAALIAWLGWSVPWRQVASLALEIGALAGIGWWYARRSLTLSRFGFAVALLLVCAVLAQLTTYTLATFHAPLRDAQLHALDTALGFDWFALYNWLYDHPTLYRVSGWIYGAFIAQSFVTASVLALGHREGATPYIRAYGVTFLITVTVATLFPALGTVEEAPAAVAMLTLRAETVHAINLYAPVGIISMPSFHAAGAVLTGIALWPIRWLRWPAVVFEAAMVCVTVPRGGHYLVDVLAGIALAVTVAWWLRLPAFDR